MAALALVVGSWTAYGGPPAPGGVEIQYPEMTVTSRDTRTLYDHAGLEVSPWPEPVRPGAEGVEFVVERVGMRGMPGWPQWIPDDTSAHYIAASPIVADLDNDGVNELFAISYRGHAYLWNPDGTIVPGWPKSMGEGTQQGVAGSPAVADIDGGADLELIVATGPFPTAQVNVWKRDGGDLPGWPQSAGPFYYSVVGGAVAGDIDGDGDPEIICGSYDLLLVEPAMVNAWHHDGTPVAGWPLEFPGIEMVITGPVSLADFDGDGDLDVVIKMWTSASPNETTVTIVDVDGVVLPGWPQIRTGGGSSAVSIGDVDLDGNLELFFGSGTGDLINALDHLGNDLPNWPPPAVTCSVSGATPALADVDGDGDLEIAFQTLCSDVFLYQHDGTLMPGWPQETGDIAVFGPVVYSSVSIGDVDGDEAVDLVMGAEGSSRVFAFDVAGNVLPGFPKLLDDDGFTQVLATPEIMDLDGDGTVDITVGGRDGAVYVWDLSADIDPCTHEWPRFRNQPARHGRYQQITDDCDGNSEPCDGDANGDGLVDPLDSGFVLARFGCPVGTGDPDCDAADQNADGVVDPLDVGYVLARFGECP